MPEQRDLGSLPNQIESFGQRQELSQAKSAQVSQHQGENPKLLLRQ